MKLEYKFGITNFVAFFVLAGLFYWLCTLPQDTLWRAVVCVLCGLLFFGMSFVVVSHQRFIRPARRSTTQQNKHPK